MGPKDRQGGLASAKAPWQEGRSAFKALRETSVAAAESEGQSGGSEAGDIGGGLAS